MLYSWFGSGQAEQSDHDDAIKPQISASPKWSCDARYAIVFANSIWYETRLASSCYKASQGAVNKSIFHSTLQSGLNSPLIFPSLASKTQKDNTRSIKKRVEHKTKARMPGQTSFTFFFCATAVLSLCLWQKDKSGSKKSKDSWNIFFFSPSTRDSLCYRSANK